VTGAGSVVAIALPLGLASATLVRELRPAAIRAAPWAALPALVLGTGVLGASAVRWESVVLGMRLGVGDPAARGFLVLTGAVWLAAGLFARAYLADDPRRGRFWGFFLATSAGNIGLVLAQDVASFYVFFALMTFAAYGLIIHEQRDEARRAARVYLVASLIGEVLLVTALLWIVGVEVNLPLREVPRRVAGAPARDLVVGFLLVGFGIKAGAIVLHVWLPVAHPVAPTPASAVLSGAMIKAGLLGWLRFLPLGTAELPGFGAVCLAAGLAAAFYAIAVGLGQRDPKTILAYSSVSQMGFMTAALGVALAAPAAAAGVISAILFYALHHALAKGALFLGTGVAGAVRPGRARRLVMLGLVWPALELAGAPLSSGALAKLSLKHAMEGSPWSWVPVGALLSVGAAGTTLLMAHFVIRALPRRDGAAPAPGLWVPWALLLALDLVLFVIPPVDREELAALVRPANLASASWPVIAGVAVYGVARALRVRPGEGRARVPPGDLLVIFEAGVAALRRGFGELVLGAVRLGSRVLARVARRISPEQVWAAVVRATASAERSLGESRTAGVAFLLLLLLLLALARLP
jgi:formate hydrogenlyase subunit 3/multisubunit Na+/H+ antiporter MnhD subunit